MDYQLTPEMQAKIREQGLGQIIVVTARMVLDLYPDRTLARARFNELLDSMIEGYDFRHQPPEVAAVARDLMRFHVDNIVSQIIDR